MEELMLKVPSYVQLAALIIAGITVIASIIVKITPSTTDDAKMIKIGHGIFKVMAWLPFFGTDPRLKNMAAAFEEMEGKMSLLKLADLIGKLIEGIMILAKKVRIIKEKEKVDEGLEEGDQRKIEDAFGSSSGPSDPNRFPGLFKRPRKKD